MDVQMKVGENGSISKSKEPPQEDFPLPHFASLAIHNLINQPMGTTACYYENFIID